LETCFQTDYFIIHNLNISVNECLYKWPFEIWFILILIIIILQLCSTYTYTLLNKVYLSTDCSNNYNTCCLALYIYHCNLIHILEFPVNRAIGSYRYLLPIVFLNVYSWIKIKNSITSVNGTITNTQRLRVIMIRIVEFLFIVHYLYTIDSINGN